MNGDVVALIEGELGDSTGPTMEDGVMAREGVVKRDGRKGKRGRHLPVAKGARSLSKGVVLVSHTVRASPNVRVLPATGRANCCT